MASSPNVLNYYIGKGEVFVKRITAPADMDFVSAGNVPELEITPTLETLDHFSSMAGVRVKDRVVVIEKGGTLRILMEEWNVRNMALMLLGEESTDSEGRPVIDIFSANSISAEVKFVGSNEVGPRYEFHFLRVDFVPGSSISPISDEWGALELTGNLVAVNGAFGTATLLGEEGEEDSESE